MSFDRTVPLKPLDPAALKKAQEEKEKKAEHPAKPEPAPKAEPPRPAPAPKPGVAPSPDLSQKIARPDLSQKMAKPDLAQKTPGPDVSQRIEPTLGVPKPEAAGLKADTTAEAWLALLAARGIEYLFANGGTDFAPLAE